MSRYVGITTSHYRTAKHYYVGKKGSDFLWDLASSFLAAGTLKNVRSLLWGRATR